MLTRNPSHTASVRRRAKVIASGDVMGPAASSFRSGRLFVFVALGIATAGLVVASAAWAHVAQGQAPAGLSAGGGAANPMPGRGRKLTVTITPSRPADGAGWYRSPVTFTTTGTGSRGGSVTCSAPQTYSGPDVSHLAIAGTCTDSMGKNATTATFDLRYDSTAPVVTVDADRPADHNGWFNKPATFSTNGTDAMSGVAGCALPVTYLAPDTAAGSLSGTCTYAAGNTGTGLAQFKYDATAPTATRRPRARRTQTAGTARRSTSRSPARTRRAAASAAIRPPRTPGQTAPRRPSAAAAPTPRETRARAARPSATSRSLLPRRPTPHCSRRRTS
jgi:hypothetical protein